MLLARPINARPPGCGHGASPAPTAIADSGAAALLITFGSAGTDEFLQPAARGSNGS